MSATKHREITIDIDEFDKKTPRWRTSGSARPQVRR